MVELRIETRQSSQKPLLLTSTVDYVPLPHFSDHLQAHTPVDGCVCLGVGIGMSAGGEGEIDSK